jgi:hypothetical protein
MSRERLDAEAVTALTPSASDGASHGVSQHPDAVDLNLHRRTILHRPAHVAVSIKKSNPLCHDGTVIAAPTATAAPYRPDCASP